MVLRLEWLNRLNLRARTRSQVFSSTSGGNGTPIQVSLGFLVPCVPSSVVTQLVLPYQ